jgi:hypothetical protein
MSSTNYDAVGAWRKSKNEKGKQKEQELKSSRKYRKHVEEVFAMRTNQLYDANSEKIAHDKICNCGSFPCTKQTKCEGCANCKCHIIVNQKLCCWCMDKRENGDYGYRYVDGEGIVNNGKKN